MPFQGALASLVFGARSSIDFLCFRQGRYKSIGFFAVRFREFDPLHASLLRNQASICPLECEQPSFVTGAVVKPDEICG